MVIIPETNLCIGLQGAGGISDIIPDKAIFLEQIHSAKILMNPSAGQKADGMIFKRGHGIPALKVADCLPVFAVWDDFVGAAHVGWRGLSKGIVENLLNSIDQPLRFLILGPCICADCYTVGKEVHEAVYLSDPQGFKEDKPGSIDLKASALRRTQRVCFEQFKVIDINECTMESPSLHSFRATTTASRNFLWLAEIQQGEHIPHLNKDINHNSLERR